MEGLKKRGSNNGKDTMGLFATLVERTSNGSTYSERGKNKPNADLTSRNFMSEKNNPRAGVGQYVFFEVTEEDAAKGLKL